jgi:phosphoribosyl-AMP cyclohydrolase
MMSEQRTDRIDALIAAVRFDDRGLVPAIAQDAEDGAVLMMAWMNAASLRATLETGRVTYWSRSRGALWRKGDTSGHVQELSGLKLDCDGDTLLLSVRQTGPACHTGTRTCFYRALGESDLERIEEPIV